MAEFKVIAIEDDIDFKELLKVYLTKFEIEFKLFPSVEEAQEHIADFFPDLLLVDIYLPGKSGVDFVKEIRKKKEFDNCMIIVSSAGMQDKEKELLECCQPIDFFNKGEDSLQGLIEKIGSYKNG